jgi:hypothetical protein
MSELKEKTYEAWEFLSGYRGCVVLPEEFRSTMRREFGDLRKKVTWTKAIARFLALNAFHDCLDAHTLVLETLNFTPLRWDYEFRDLIFDEFIMIPGAIDLIKLGLNQVFSASFTDAERDEAHGFFELVSREQERIGLPTEFAGRLPATYAA